jgi:ABC-2 type transport system permease protein
MSLLKFECINLLKNKINYLPFIVLTLLLLIPVIFHREVPWSEIDELKANQFANEQTIDAIKDDDTAAGTIEDLKIANKNIEAVISALQSQDTNKIVESKYIFEEKNLEDMLSGKLVGIPIIEQKKVVSKLNYLNQKNYPLVSLDDTRILPLANYYELIFSGTIPSILFLAISAILVATITSYEKRKQYIVLINILPKRLVSKNVVRFFSYFLFSSLSVLLPLALVSLIVAIKNGMGNFNYPIATIVNSDVSILPISTFFYQNIIFIILWILLLILISFFLSIFTGNYLVNIGGLFLSLLITNYNISPTGANNNNFIQYLPTSYVDFQQVVLGGTGFEPLKSPNINFINGIGTLITFNIFLILITIFVLVRKKRY